jgi:hypothetical protein
MPPPENHHSEMSHRITLLTMQFYIQNYEVSQTDQSLKSSQKVSINIVSFPVYITSIFVKDHR